jgi:hypothetical protein
VPAKSPDWPDSGRSAVSAGTSLHAPFATFATTASNRRVGWFSAVPDLPAL